METDKFLELKHFVNHKGTALIPATIESKEWLETLSNNYSVNFKVIESRDLKLHKAYFGMLSFIWERLPLKFKNKCSKTSFHEFIKHLAKEYVVEHTFKDGSQKIKYNSISFGKMNNVKFKEYFNNILSVIYEDLLIPLDCDYIMDLVNEEWQKTLDKLI